MRIPRIKKNPLSFFTISVVALFFLGIQPVFAFSVKYTVTYPSGSNYIKLYCGTHVVSNNSGSVFCSPNESTITNLSSYPTSSTSGWYQYGSSSGLNYFFNFEPSAADLSNIAQALGISLSALPGSPQAPTTPPPATPTPTASTSSPTPTSSNTTPPSSTPNASCTSTGSSDFNCYSLLTPLPQAGGTSISTINTSNPLPYIITMAQILVSLGIVIAVFFIVYGGIIKMTTDNVEKHREGTEIIKRTIYGLLLLAFSYILIVTINPNLLNNPFTELGIKSGIGTSTPNLNLVQKPTNIAVTCIPGEQFTLEWNEAGANNTTNYDVYMSQGPLTSTSNQNPGFQAYQNIQGVLQANGKFQKTFNNYNLTSGQQYSVWLSALGGISSSVEGPSNGTTFTCQAPPPINVSSSCSNGEVVTVGNGSSAYNAYTAYMNDCTGNTTAANAYVYNSNTQTLSCKVNNNGFTCNFTGAVPGHTYCVWVNGQSSNINVNGKQLAEDVALGALSPTTLAFTPGAGSAISYQSATSKGAAAKPVTCPVLQRPTNLQISCILSRSSQGFNANNQQASYIMPGGLTITWTRPKLYKNFEVYFNPTNQIKKTQEFGSVTGNPFTCNTTTCTYTNTSLIMGSDPFVGITNSFHTVWVNTVSVNNATGQTTEGVNNGVSGIVQCVYNVKP